MRETIFLRCIIDISRLITTCYVGSCVCTICSLCNLRSFMHASHFMRWIATGGPDYTRQYTIVNKLPEANLAAAQIAGQADYDGCSPPLDAAGAYAAS